ncbi:hypothetical protein GCM10025779_24300 [Arthrobacter cryoconiti]
MGRNSPYIWRDYADWEHSSTQELGTWLAALSIQDRESVQESVEALRQLAAGGELEEGCEDELGPCSVDPVIWALKWTFLDRHIRQYHAEPTDHPELLVSLHIHTKPRNTAAPGVWATVKAQQDLEMSQAKLRYLSGASSEWMK